MMQVGPHFQHKRDIQAHDSETHLLAENDDGPAHILAMLLTQADFRDNSRDILLNY